MTVAAVYFACEYLLNVVARLKVKRARAYAPMVRPN
jgi:hypothetical protein